MCPVWRMETAAATTFESTCGILMSPHLPGLVAPALYVWTISGPDWSYYSIQLYYVRGPALNIDCNQHFGSE